MKITFLQNKRYKVAHLGTQWIYCGTAGYGKGFKFKTINNYRTVCITERRAKILFPQVWNLQLTDRWGFDSTLLGKWAAADKHEKRLRLLHAGMAVTTETPLIPIDQLEATCNERGFTVAELCRWSDYSRNSLKGFGIDEKRVVRLWDLINGAKEMYIICQ